MNCNSIVTIIYLWQFVQLYWEATSFKQVLNLLFSMWMFTHEGVCGSQVDLRRFPQLLSTL